MEGSHENEASSIHTCNALVSCLCTDQWMAVIPSISAREGSMEERQRHKWRVWTVLSPTLHIFIRCTSPAYVTMVTLRIKSIPPPLSFSFSMCSGFPWKADHMRGVIIELSLKFAWRPGTCMVWVVRGEYNRLSRGYLGASLIPSPNSLGTRLLCCQINIACAE